jgi:hypothetical protein
MYVKSTTPRIAATPCYRMPCCLSKVLSSRFSTKLSGKDVGKDRHIVKLSCAWGTFLMRSLILSNIFTSTIIEMSMKKIVWMVLLAGVFLITLLLLVALLVFIPFDEVDQGSKMFEKALIVVLIISLIYLQYRILKKLKK